MTKAQEPLALMSMAWAPGNKYGVESLTAILLIQVPISRRLVFHGLIVHHFHQFSIGNWVADLNNSKGAQVGKVGSRESHESSWIHRNDHITIIYA